MVTAASQSHAILPLPSFIEPGYPVCFEHVAWATYEMLRQQAPTAWRLTYDRGTLEILSPSRKHEVTAELLGDLFKAFCELRNIDFVSLRSTTQKVAQQHGGEPDASFALRSADQEVPDLVIEVEVTSRLTAAKRKLYHALGVREMWCYRPDGQLDVMIRKDAGWETTQTSMLCPDIPIDRLAFHASQPGWSNRIVQAFKAELLLS